MKYLNGLLQAILNHPASFVLAGLLLWCAQPLHRVILNLEDATSKGPTITKNISEITAAANDKEKGLPATLATINDKEKGLPATFAAINGKHGIKQVLYNTNALTAQIARTSNTVRLAASEQRVQARLLNAEILGMVKDTNENLNGSEGTLTTLNDDLKKVGRTLDTITDKDGILQVSAQTLIKAGSIFDEIKPDTKRMIFNLAESSVHVNGATGHFERTLGYIEDGFKPRKISFWKNLGMQLLPIGLKQAATFLFPTRVTVTNEPTVTIKPEEKK